MARDAPPSSCLAKSPRRISERYVALTDVTQVTFVYAPPHPPGKGLGSQQKESLMTAAIKKPTTRLALIAALTMGLLAALAILALAAN